MRRRMRLSDPVTKRRGSRRVTPVSELRVGDVIRLIRIDSTGYGSTDGPRNGQSGIVREAPTGIEFFRPFEGGHDLAGRAKNGHGWWISSYDRVSRFDVDRRRTRRTAR